MISTAMFPSISAGRYAFPIGIYRVEARDLFWFLLCLALLPLTRRRFRLTPDGLDAVTSFGCKRFVRWDDVASLHFSKLFGFVLKLADGRRLSSLARCTASPAFRKRPPRGSPPTG
jgi:hypothetical protein